MDFSVNETQNGTAEDAMSLAMSYTMYKIGKYHFMELRLFTKSNSDILWIFAGHTFFGGPINTPVWTSGDVCPVF